MEPDHHHSLFSEGETGEASSASSQACEGEGATGRAILLTPPGGAAIAVVRIVGADVERFLQRHFSRAVPEGRAVHGELRDGDRIIDDPVIVRPRPGVADINLHGGPWIIHSTLELLARGGFAVVHAHQPQVLDEAVDADTAIEREVLIHLPLARTELTLRVLLAQPAAWETLLAEVERDLSASRPRIQRMLEDRSLIHLLHPPRVAIIGPPNAGKSTLANQLFAQERSITADLAGTTRDWVGEIANVNGLAVMLVDTPGLRETTDPIEQIAIERSGGQIERADLIVLVLDPTQPPEPDQRRLLDRYPHALLVVNKSDRQPAWRLPGPPALHTVATTGEGIEAVRIAIAGHFGCDGIDAAQPRVWTDRQRKLLSAS